MKNRIKNYKISLIISFMIMGLTMMSCEKYLDKAPTADLSDKDVFGTFKSFQGFVEEMYNCETDINKTLGGDTYFQNAGFADECLSNKPMLWDDGNYWDQVKFLGAVNTNNDPMSKKMWPLCWYGIRKANIALTKMDVLTGTQQEKNFLKGQCLFFRGFYHFELMRYYGGLPYIDTLLSASSELNLPRLNYRETALKAAKDFTAAAALLPVRWDDSLVGQKTLGNNSQRISKVHALSYLGKNLLYAASPMMNEESTGINAYDVELCKQAAASFAQVIDICNTTGAYKMQTWSTWTDNFWVWSTGNKVRSGGTEVIMNPTVYNKYSAKFTTCRTSTPVTFTAGNPSVEVPTQNFIKNYGMANGLPLDDPNSGYNPNDPWTGRDPRFYKDIVYDGVQMVTSTAAAAANDRFAQLYKGGRHKGGINGSVTGYFYRKWTPVGCNPWDNKWGAFMPDVPFMRLADVYLMYAEAVLQGYGTAQSSVPGGMTAEAALNVVRNRAGLPNITSAYTGDKDKFMSEIIRDRAVELAFESHRWFDLRRWNIAGQSKYLLKTGLDFDRGANGKPINIQEKLIYTKVFEKKHKWLPFQVSYTKLYKEFPQNPGW